MTTREQALAAFERRVRNDYHALGEVTPMERREVDENIVRAYLAQPEGGDVEEALEAVAALDDIVVEAIYDLVDDGQSGKGPQDYLRDWATIRSALRSAKEREAAAVERTVEKAKAIGEEACKLYCRWYDHGVPSYMNGGAVAYEMVSAIRSILAALDSLKETP